MWSYTKTNYDALRQFEISHAEYAFIDFVYKSQNHVRYSDEGYCVTSNTDIARHICINKSNVGRIAKRMADRGLIAFDNGNKSRKKATALWINLCDPGVAKRNELGDAGVANRNSRSCDSQQESCESQQESCESQQESCESQQDTYIYKEKERKGKVSAHERAAGLDADASGFEPSNLAKGSKRPEGQDPPISPPKDTSTTNTPVPVADTTEVERYLREKLRRDLAQEIPDGQSWPDVAAEMARAFVSDGKTFNPKNPGSCKGLKAWATSYVSRMEVTEAGEPSYTHVSRRYVDIWAKANSRIVDQSDYNKLAPVIREHITKPGVTEEELREAIEIMKGSQYYNDPANVFREVRSVLENKRVNDERIARVSRRAAERRKALQDAA